MLAGATVYGVPLKNMARAYAALSEAEFMEGKYRKSQNYVRSAMTMYPEMIAGEDRLDTALMRNFGEKLLSKMGAEGAYCCGILDKGMGVAIKIEDGSLRAVSPVVIEVLIQLNIINKEKAEVVKEFWKPKVINHRGEEVGAIRPVFKLR